MNRILLVEDEQKIADFVIQGLQSEGFDVSHESDGVKGQITAQRNGFDLILLDIMLPGKSGTEVLEALRNSEIKTPVIMLTAKSELSDKLLGFKLGADDYLAKPFFMEELLARCKVLLNRHQISNLDIITVGELSLDKVSRRVTWRDKSMILSQREFTLLEYLMRSPGNVFSRQQIMQFVWGIDFNTQTNIVDVCIQRIRRKLINTEKNELSEFPIESIRGIGYKIKKSDE
jgi:DNA-binding response OmpR family regulator